MNLFQKKIQVDPEMRLKHKTAAKVASQTREEDPVGLSFFLKRSAIVLPTSTANAIPPQAPVSDTN